jgi:hypothetical protein
LKVMRIWISVFFGPVPGDPEFKSWVYRYESIVSVIIVAVIVDIAFDLFDFLFYWSFGLLLLYDGELTFWPVRVSISYWDG